RRPAGQGGQDAALGQQAVAGLPGQGAERSQRHVPGGGSVDPDHPAEGRQGEVSQQRAPARSAGEAQTVAFASAPGWFRFWGVACALLLLLLVAVPLAWPLGEVEFAFSSLPRLALLGRNTALLVLGVVALALPAGVVLAVLLERTDLVGRRDLAL